MAVRLGDTATVPCLATDPHINVSLVHAITERPVGGVYSPTDGFTGIMEEDDFRCRGELNGVTKDSEPFHVYSIIGNHGNTHKTRAHSLSLCTYTLILKLADSRYKMN